MADLLMIDGQTTSDDTMKDMFFIFEIDGEDYGIEVANIKEIVSMTTVKITKVPQMPGFIEGIISLRGDLVGILDVRKRFGKMPREYDEATCLVIIIYDDYYLGLIVDNVKATQTIESKNVSPPPSARLNSYNQFIRNIGQTPDGVKLILDLDRFLEQ